MALTQPTTKDVADLLHQRTVTSGNIYLGDFSDELGTVPGAERAESLIVKAHDHVFGKLGDPEDWPVPANDLAEHSKDATRMIELYAAMLIELSHYPDQIRLGNSPYEELKKLFDEGMAGLIEALKGEGLALTDEEGATTDTGGTSMGSYDFPPTSIGDGIMP